MKKATCAILFFMVLGWMTVSGQNPIPAYNIPVYHIANFQETASAPGDMNTHRGKRSVVVRANGYSSYSATYYVYSLDYQDILGPFTIYGGQTRYTDIDTREWGVLIESESHLTVDVWIEEENRGIITHN